MKEKRDAFALEETELEVSGIDCLVGLEASLSVPEPILPLALVHNAAPVLEAPNTSHTPHVKVALVYAFSRRQYAHPVVL